MDTLTQIALGATVAEAGFRHRLGGKAVLFGAACGLASDLDMVARLGGEFASLVHHRGITHSLLALTIAAPLVGYAGYRWSGRRDRWLIWTHGHQFRQGAGRLVATQHHRPRKIERNPR